jgi:hypothetical protein
MPFQDGPNRTALTAILPGMRKVPARNSPDVKLNIRHSGFVRVNASIPMSEQQIIHSATQPRRQDPRDLQSRLYREIGLAAVEAALSPSDMQGGGVRALFEARDDRATTVALRSSGRAA